MPFQIIRNDITKVAADAIVNTANRKPKFADGTDRAIYTAAGAEQLLEERKKIGEIGVGKAAVTPAFALPAKYIIHTVGPVWIDGTHGEAEAVRSCYHESLKAAEEMGCGSIAFPLIATGNFGFPKDLALQIALSEFSSYLMTHEMDITLVVFDRSAFELSGRLLEDVGAFIDEHYVEEARAKEYGSPEGRRRRRLNEILSFHRRRDSAKADAAPLPGSAANNAFPMAGAAAKEAFPAEEAEEEVVPEEEESQDQALTNESIPAWADADMMQSAMPSAYADSGLPEVGEPPEFGAAPSYGATPSYGAAPSFGMAPPAAPSAPLPANLDELMKTEEETFQEKLFSLIAEKNLTNAEVYKRANLDRKHFSKIQCNKYYSPKKKTVLAFAIALQLDLDETQDLLRRAEFAFSPGSKVDLIVEYCILNGIYDIIDVNAILFKYQQPVLGA